MVDKIIPPKSETKFEVFISSPLDSLKKVRRCIIDATLETGHIPCAMEFFAGSGYSAPTSTTLELAIEYIMRSDIFVLIVGAHYGTELIPGDLVNKLPRNLVEKLIPGGSEKSVISFTEFEYGLAKEFGKPRIILLLHKETANKIRDDSKLTESEKKNGKDYDNFRNQFDNPIEMKCIFTSLTKESKIKDLKKDYIIALNRVTRRLEGNGGWNRANSELVADIIAKLNSNTTLGNRAQNNSDLKIAIARVFISKYLPALIAENYRKFFFESGSSTAFVAKEFVDLIQRDPTIPWALESKSVHIKTNNILAYIYFRLNLRLGSLNFSPDGLPKDEYGATYGKLENFIGHGCAHNLKKSPEKFFGYFKKHDDVEIVLTSITKEFDDDYVVNIGSGKGMIFMAASGIGTISDNAGKFQGPHVGSFINMLFKKSILASKCPTVMFLDQTKLLEEPVNRYPVCDDKLIWSDICKGSISSPFHDLKEDLPKKEKPFAIAVGTSADRKEEIKKRLNDLLPNDPLPIVVDEEVLINNKTVFGLVAANSKFREIICPP